MYDAFLGKEMWQIIVAKKKIAFFVLKFFMFV